MSDPVIRIVDLYKSFAGFKVLDGLSLDIERGLINFIIGRSGGGKSVLLKHIIGLMKPDRGHIYLDGQDMVAQNDQTLNQLRKRFGMLFQEAALFDSMTVGENVAFPLKEHTKLKTKDISRLVSEKLALVGLTGVENMMPSSISGGMRKRVGLARAMILSPEILLFDEPTTGLDPIMCDQVDELILTTQRQLGVTCIVISHDMAATLRIAHKVAMIYKGKIVCHGTPAEIKALDNPVVRQFLRGEAEGPMDLGE
ncbi:MAG: ABC transporter ATP-binding protein [Deltaproteobacteria bacterium]|nr:ABC transporter ATP-binding protein [Deltaproteobacteria bacterium]